MRPFDFPVESLDHGMLHSFKLLCSAHVSRTSQAELSLELCNLLCMLQHPDCKQCLQLDDAHQYMLSLLRIVSVTVSMQNM